MDERNLIAGVRITCLVVFLYSALSITWTSTFAFLTLAASVFILRPSNSMSVNLITQIMGMGKSNPLRGKPRVTEEGLPEDVHRTMVETVYKSVVYNAMDTDSLYNFGVIKDNTECIFAPKAKVWGSAKWIDSLSSEENIFRWVPTFLKFTILCRPLGLDGFLIELPPEYGQDVHTFGDAVRRVLGVLSDNDPSGLHCMREKSIHRKTWVFQFQHETFFITTFAPCYPETHSRYGFGCKYAYIFFQPEVSFAQHDLPLDTPHTNWDSPKTVRDRIRVGFRNSGREYRIRDTVSFPMVEDIVKPITDNGQVIKWWVPSDDL